MTNRRANLGMIGEDLAEAMLDRAGWEILQRNVRLGRGELDLVAREGDTLVFVEVKTIRLGRDLGQPGPERAALQVDSRKRRKIRRLAAEWLAAGLCPAGISEFRFDVVGVEFICDEREIPPRIEHIRGAFDGMSGG